MKRQFITMILLLLASGGLFAQHQHEISVYGGGGLSSLNYKPTFGDQKLRLGGHTGIGYHFFFAPKWAIGTGLEFACYNAKFTMNNLDVRYMTTDRDGDRFEFRSMVNDYEEKQRATMLQIPLMLQFQTPMAESTRQFYAAAGGKIGFPLNGKYNNKASFINAGYYAHENALYDTQEFMGFGAFPNRKTKGGLDFKTAFFLSAEAGIKWRLNDKFSLYTGAYLDLGLNNIVKTQNAASQPFIVEYNNANPTAFAANSIIKSQYPQGGNATTQAFTEKVKPIALGIKVRLAFGKDCKRSPKEKPVIEAPERVEKTPEEPKPVVEEPTPEETPVVEEKTPEKPVVEDKTPDVVKEGMPDAVKRQIEQPIDNYVISHMEVASYQRQRLDEKIALLQQYPNARFRIYGHTCDLGNEAVNERIGLGRAANAKAYLISKGIAESRILSISSKRDTEPVVPNSSEENRKKNRRVVIIIE